MNGMSAGEFDRPLADRIGAELDDPPGSKRDADFQVCRIAGFQTRKRPGRSDSLPIWNSAIQQVWKPAPPGLCALAPIRL